MLPCAHAMSSLDDCLSGSAAVVSTTDYWKKQWYPVAIAAITDRQNPVPFTLLGKNIVIWWDGDKWRCVDDACPHR